MRYGMTVSEFRENEPEKPIKHLMGWGGRATPETKLMQSLGMKPTTSGVAVCKEGEAFHFAYQAKAVHNWARSLYYGMTGSPHKC